MPQRLDFVALFDRQVVAENDHADAVLFQVEGQPDDAAGKLDHLAGHDAGQTMHASDPVAHFEHRADLSNVQLTLELLDFLLDHRRDLVRIKLHERYPSNSAIKGRVVCRRVSAEPYFLVTETALLIR